jgi:ectoine hydroxylase-related dioxygenase (phytanoyl-CoA dioxygenase family)
MLGLRHRPSPSASSAEFWGLRTRFEQDGYVKVERCFEPVEIAALRRESHRLCTETKELPPEIVWFSPAVDGGCIVQRISRTNWFSPLIQRFGAEHSAMRSICASLLQTESVQFADGHEGSDGTVLVVKDARNASEHRKLRWHRDNHFTGHLPIDPFLNAGIYLDDSDADRGCLVVIPESHRVSNFDQELCETTTYHAGELNVCAQAGDLVIHHSALWHRSGAFTLPSGVRRILYFNYFVGRSTQ